MFRTRVTCALACVFLGDAARMAVKKGNATQEIGELGSIKELFTLGSPGTASPGLHNRKARNGCFPGIRVYTSDRSSWTPKYDLFVQVTMAVGFHHAKMDVKDIDESNPGYPGDATCGVSNDITQWPRWGIPNTALHAGPVYIDLTRRDMNSMYADWAVLIRTGQMVAAEELVAMAPDYGWHSVAYNYGAHLLQNPDTLDCLLGFRGTDGTDEWIGNAMIGLTKFCGLVNEDDECDETPCEPEKDHGSFTHWGFTTRMQSIVADDDYQNNIRTALPKCNNVYVAGHSAGGAMAELFTACIFNAPEPGSYGYSDFEKMSWRKESPQRMPYLA